MNKIKLSLVCFLLFACNSGLLAQFTHVGASANYGTWINEFGASAYVIYSVGNKIDIVPNGTYFWPHEIEINETLKTGTEKYTWWSINMDGHYVLYEKSVFHIFGLMGMNFTNETKLEDYVTQGQPFKIKTTTTKIGLNVGAGIQFPLSKFFIPFTEVKYTLGERHQFCFSLGVLVRIAPDKVRDEIE
jgi:hypothetical protein